MTKQEYMNLFYPVVERVCEYAVKMEEKHGEGITHTQGDVLAAAGHCISEYRGKPNEDGETHAVGGLLRLMKVVLDDCE